MSRKGVSCPLWTVNLLLPRGGPGVCDGLGVCHGFRRSELNLQNVGKTVVAKVIAWFKHPEKLGPKMPRSRTCPNVQYQSAGGRTWSFPGWLPDFRSVIWNVCFFREIGLRHMGTHMSLMSKVVGWTGRRVDWDLMLYWVIQWSSTMDDLGQHFWDTRHLL